MTLLSDAIPALSRELHQLLIAAGEPELAAQVAGLQIVDRCRCGGGHCATIKTQWKPAAKYQKHGGMMLRPSKGMMIIDTEAGRIACVEVLDRPEYVRALDAVIPRRN